MTHSAMPNNNWSPDKMGQGYLYSTLRLPKTPNHNGIRLSDVEESDFSDAETSYSLSRSPAFIQAEGSPTSCTVHQSAAALIRHKCAPTNQGGRCSLGTYQLDDAPGPDEDNDYDSGTGGDGSEASEHDGHLLGIGKLRNSGSEGLVQHTQPTTEYLSPASESPLTTSSGLSPLNSVAHLKLLQSLADSGGNHLDSEEDEEDENGSDSLGSLSPLTELSSPASSPGVVEGGTVPPAAYEFDEAHPRVDCLLSPLRSLDHLADIPLAGVSSPEDGEPEELVLH